MVGDGYGSHTCFRIFIVVAVLITITLLAYFFNEVGESIANKIAENL